jgi:hypothetical protein
VGQNRLVDAIRSVVAKADETPAQAGQVIGTLSILRQLEESHDGSYS